MAMGPGGVSHRPRKGVPMRAREQGKTPIVRGTRSPAVWLCRAAAASATLLNPLQACFRLVQAQKSTFRLETICTA